MFFANFKRKSLRLSNGTPHVPLQNFTADAIPVSKLSSGPGIRLKNRNCDPENPTYSHLTGHNLAKNPPIHSKTTMVAIYTS
jgi:hypothetical protein